MRMLRLSLQTYELYVVRYFYRSGCCSTPRIKQDHAIMVSEISRFVPPEPNMCLLPQQVLAVAIGNCPNIKVQNKNVQTLKIMSHGPISFSEWVGVCVHSSHFWPIFSPFLMPFLISVYKNELQNWDENEPKMIIFEKLNSTLAFAKMIILHPFLHSIFVVLSNSSDAWSFCSDHHHQWWLPPSHLVLEGLVTQTRK